MVGAVTQPDRPAGRGRKLRSSPVKEAALEEDLPVLTPDPPRGDEFVASVRALSPDVSVVVAYGHILPREVLELPRLGSLNVHASLLPALRGAAPVNWAIVQGHERTGVTVMRMVEEMDAGPILVQREEPIEDEDTASSLSLRLSELGAGVLLEALALVEMGKAEGREQDHEAATFAPKVDRETARVRWSRTAGELGRWIRGMDQVPGAWSPLGDEPVKLYAPEPLERVTDAEPGTVVAADPDHDGLVVAAGRGAVRIEEVQPPGKKRMSARDWIRGRGPSRGDRFG